MVCLVYYLGLVFLRVNFKPHIGCRSIIVLGTHTYKGEPNGEVTEELCREDEDPRHVEV